MDDLKVKYEEKILKVETSPVSVVNVDLHFNTSSFEKPQLTSVVNSLRLLSLNTRSSVVNEATRLPVLVPPPSLSDNEATRLPVLGPPPSLSHNEAFRLPVLGPPPSLSYNEATRLPMLGPPPCLSHNETFRLPVLGPPPSLSHGQISLTNNLTSSGAAIARPVTAASPRPDPAYLPASTTTATSRTRAVPTPADGRPKSYIKLVTQLKGHFLELSTSDALRYIHMLRRENNDKLSGLMMQTIYDRVVQFMRADRNMRMVDMENDMDNNCSICLEDMTERDSRMLNPCRHKFHNHCINDWLDKPGGGGNTCPMCRHFIVQEDKFPDLGHGSKRKL